MKCKYCAGELDSDDKCTVCGQYTVPIHPSFITPPSEEDTESQEPIRAVFYARDLDELELLSHATGYYLAYWDIGQFLREIDKWHLDDYKDAPTLLDAIRDKYYELKEEYHLPQD